MPGPPVFLRHTSSFDHDPGPHPEQPARIAAIERALAARNWLDFAVQDAPPAAREVLEAIHPPAHVEAIERLCAGGGGTIDADTAVSAGSFQAALHASGGAVRLAELLAGGEARAGFSAHRPPGHHATRDRAMGFCLFNHVAVAAQHALDALGLERVMVLDWDVHHGNGTSDIFWSTDRVLYLSIHQWPLYPGTGAPSDLGAGPGEGFTVNLPVPAGTGDADYLSLIAHVAVPLAREWGPQLILLSAGFDAHRDDPLADCRVTEAGFAAMAAHLTAVAAEVGAPLGGVLEGGYALDALGRSVLSTLEVLGADPPVAPPAPGEASALALAARSRLAPWWSFA